MTVEGIRIQKITREFDDLESQTASIAALAGEIWREHYTPIIGSGQVEYMLEKFQSAQQVYKDIAKNNYTYFTACEMVSNEMIGYCCVIPEDDRLLLSKLYIRRDYRGKGIARRFVDEAVLLCRADYKIRLTVNKHNTSAIAAYRKMGFNTVDSIKTDIGGGFFMDDYVMELDSQSSSRYSKDELTEAHRSLESTLRKCEKMDVTKLGKSQQTLLDRRIKALRIALALIEREIR